MLLDIKGLIAILRATHTSELQSVESGKLSNKKKWEKCCESEANKYLLLNVPCNLQQNIESSRTKQSKKCLHCLYAARN